MADAITFAPYLGWVDVPNPNEPPANARFITAADLKRYETFGRDASALLNAHAVRLDGLGTSLGALDARVGGIDTRVGGIATRLDNTSTGLDTKAPKANPTFTGTVSGISATMVGLGNVNNTSDANKPVSTAQKTYIDAVGTRVTALEASGRHWRGTRTADLTISNNNETLIATIPSVSLTAGRTYEIVATGSFYSQGADHALQAVVRKSAKNITTVNANDPKMLDGTLWTHPTRAEVGAFQAPADTYVATATESVRVYLTLQRVVGTAGIVLTAAAINWKLSVKELGAAATV